LHLRKIYLVWIDADIGKVQHYRLSCRPNAFNFFERTTISEVGRSTDARPKNSDQ